MVLNKYLCVPLPQFAQELSFRKRFCSSTAAAHSETLSYRFSVRFWPVWSKLLLSISANTFLTCTRTSQSPLLQHLESESVWRVAFLRTGVTLRPPQNSELFNPGFLVVVGSESPRDALDRTKHWSQLVWSMVHFSRLRCAHSSPCWSNTVRQADVFSRWNCVWYSESCPATVRLPGTRNTIHFHPTTHLSPVKTDSNHVFLSPLINLFILVC